MNQMMINSMWIQGTIGIFLLISSWLDIRKKMVSGIVLLIFAIIGWIFYFALNPMNILVLAGGMGIGVIVVLISKITDGQIGMGDGGLLCVTGIYMGLYKNLELFFGGLLLASLWGIFLLVTKRGKRKTEIPFVPFLAASYFIMIIA